MDVVDILIHVHPAMDGENRERIEKALLASDGVVTAVFSAEHPHTLVVAYDPEAAQSGRLLQIVREWDPAASLVGL